METILDRLRQHARDRGDAIAMTEELDDGRHDISWRGVDEIVERAARGLIALGVEARGSVGILGVNRPRWSLTCLATMAVGGQPAGIYQTCAANQVAYILRHGRCRVVFVDSSEQWHKVEAQWPQLPDLAYAVLMTEPDGDLDIAAEPRLLTWDAFLAAGDAVAGEEVEARRRDIDASTPATLIYTSGTTGDPKAVILSHGNIMETGSIGASLHDLGHRDRLVSYLPLAHIAEQMMSVHISIYCGYRVFYVASPDLLAAALSDARPTLFFGVPRVWERIHDALTDRVDQAPMLRRALARWALAVGWRAAQARLEGRPPGPWTALQHRLADRLVLSKVRRRLGFDAVRIGASGAAPIRQQILQLFYAIGIPIYEVYGLSETCGPTSWNAIGRTKLGTVGRPIPRVEVRIAADQEVLIRGPNVFSGYLDDPEASGEALDAEGWFHSGDLGYLDDEGYLVISGRKKDLLITSGGKNIAPAAIESALQQIPDVQEAVVLGDGRRFLTALIGLAPDVEHDDRTRVRLQAEIDGVNQRLARVETLRNFRILPRPLSQEEGELTPTLKVKRHVVQEHFADLIEEMYDER